MTSRPILAALALSAGLAAVPAFAATPPNQPNDASPNHTEKALANNGKWSNSTSDKPADQLNPLLTREGMVRMSKLIGTDIYNDQDKKLGSVADVIMGRTGEPSVIVKADGKLHQVQWSKLRFGDAQKSADNKVLMPGETKSALNGTPEFHYKGSGSGKSG